MSASGSGGVRAASSSSMELRGVSASSKSINSAWVGGPGLSGSARGGGEVGRTAASMFAPDSLEGPNPLAAAWRAGQGIGRTGIPRRAALFACPPTQNGRPCRGAAARTARSSMTASQRDGGLQATSITCELWLISCFIRRALPEMPFTVVMAAHRWSRFQGMES